MSKKDPAPVAIKRFGGTRLYDTKAARYVTIDDIRQMDEDGVAFVITDDETGEDITRSLAIPLH
jgi:polyhydroxyalkanoate synthesis regulator protein